MNALSVWLELEIHRDGKIYTQRFERGNAVTDLTVTGSTDRTGTIVTFQPDPEIFKRRPSMNTTCSKPACGNRRF